MVVFPWSRWSALARCTVILAFLCFGWAQSSWQKSVSELLEKGQLQEARRILLKLVLEDPGNQDLQAILGQIAFSLKEYGEAAERFGKCPSKLSMNPILLLNYAESLLHTRANQAALKALEQLPDENTLVQFEAGLIAARFAELAAAERHFRLAQAGYPDPQAAAYSLALAQYRQNKFEECAATLEEIRGGWTISNPPDPPGHPPTETRERILDLMLLAQKEAPIDVLEQAIDHNPGDEINYLAAAERLAEENKLLQAAEFVEQGLEQLPNSYGLRFKHGHVRYLLAQYGEAQSEYRKAVELRPDLDIPRVGLALALIASRAPGEASAVLEEVLRLIPSSFYGHYLLGEVAILDGVEPGSQAEEKGLEHLKQATSLRPAFFFWAGSSPLALAHTSLGKLYLKRGDASSAARELEKAVRLDPDATPAFYQLSIAYRKLGEKERGREALAQVRRLNNERRQTGKRESLYRALQKARVGNVTPPG